MLKIIKGLIPFGFKRKIKQHLGVPSSNWSFNNLKRKGIYPEMVMDIGAYEGEWTIDFLEVFPAAKLVMVEAQAKKEKLLQQVVNKYPNTRLVNALLSSEAGKQVSFYENETASHITQAASGNEEHIVNVVTKTVDSIIEENNFDPPDFLKIDVQGHELEVLKGAEKAMKTVEVLMLEVSLLNLDDSPLILELMNYMDQKGFQLYDICQFMRRPFDKALYQADVLFVKKDSFLVTDKQW